jgi:hypothetical protein
MSKRLSRNAAVAAVTLLAGLMSCRAGCTHWHVHVAGEVAVDPVLAQHRGAPIRLLLTSKPTPMKRVTSKPDLKDTKGRPQTIHRDKPLVKTFHAEDGGRYQKGQSDYPFQFCSGLLDVWYQANLHAYLDLNKNGRLDPGEPVGSLKQNPLNRKKELALSEGERIVIKPVVTPRVAPRRAPPKRKGISPIVEPPREPPVKKRPRPAP